MGSLRIHPHRVIGVLLTLVFLLLLTIRLGFFEKGEDGRQGSRPSGAEAWADRETWMNILLQGRKIGYVHRQFLKSEEGFTLRESVSMRINMVGMVQDVRYRTEGNLHPDFTLSGFDFELQSSRFRFRARGMVEDNILTLFMGPPGFEKKSDLPVEEGVHLPFGILEALRGENLKSGDKRIFLVFDPATATKKPVKISVLAEETIPIMGREERAKKISVDFMGVQQTAWIGKDGTALKEEGAFGIKLEQVAREVALQDTPILPGEDLAEVASIPANKFIDDSNRLQELRIRLEGIENGSLFLDGGRQSLSKNILTVRKESLLGLGARTAGGEGEDRSISLRSTPFIQSDHPEIQAKVREIVSRDDPDVVRAKKLVAWVNRNIQKRPVLSLPNALDVLRQRVGDCNEHAVLLAALARATGIPAQVEAGLVYQNGKFYYHAWNALYLGSWITADSVMGQLPADVTHIRFVRGTENQMDLLGIIGKVRLEILSFS
jgi:hypothetical protein